MVPPWGRLGGAGDSGLDGTVPAGLEMVPGQENPEGVAGSGDAPAWGAQGVARGGQMWRKGKVGAERTSKGGGRSQKEWGLLVADQAKNGVAPPWGPGLVFEEIKRPTHRSRFLLTSSPNITMERGAPASKLP